MHIEHIPIQLQQRRVCNNSGNTHYKIYAWIDKQNAENISLLFWYDNRQHLFFGVGDKFTYRVLQN